mmetsp:Transcript_8699/g.21917  ORF Transcript_8699/g.21917 Transcript_8699/m.21917 type:complete len:209 (-) Transcript_8699:521-1147(-)
MRSMGMSVPTTCGFVSPMALPLVGSINRCPTHASRCLSSGAGGFCWMVANRSLRVKRLAGVGTVAFPKNGSTLAFPIHESPDTSPALRAPEWLRMLKRSLRPLVMGAGGLARPFEGSRKMLPIQVSALGASGLEYCIVSKSPVRPEGLVGPAGGGRFAPAPGPAPVTSRSPVCLNLRSSSTRCAPSFSPSWNRPWRVSIPYTALPANF